jgi:hypothetical protein
MSLTLHERRHIAVVSGEQRVDLAIPLDETLGDVLRAVGFVMEPGRHVVLERSGSEAHLATRGADLVDGAVLSVVDLRAQLFDDSRKARAEVAHESGALWWLLAAVGIVAVGVQALQATPTSSANPVDALQRLLAASALGLAALVSALVWARRQRADNSRDAVAMLSPIVVAFAAGFVIIPLNLVEGIHLAIVSGLLVASLLAAFLTLTVGGLRLRSSAGIATLVLLVLSGIWGLSLMAEMGVPAAAAISVGAVPLALRALPATLVNIDEGHHIDFAKFMSNRWTVRGSVPESPTEIVGGEIRAIVEESSARLLAGTALVSVVAVVCMPLALTADVSTNPLLLGGVIALFASVVIALLLVSRHTARPPLRWIPRGASIIIVIVGMAAATVAFGTLALTIAAASFFVVGVFSAALAIPLSKGARSLVWSRIADVCEVLAVVVSLPAALLAADVLSVLRGMMAA